MTTSSRVVFLLFSFVILFDSPAFAFIHLKDCNLVDENERTVKEIGVNYVDGFWRFAQDGDRMDYLSDLKVLKSNNIRFLRMAFGPWARYEDGAPPSPNVVAFVENQQTYLSRLAIFLRDARDQELGVVLNVFWDAEPYLQYFHEKPSDLLSIEGKTNRFLRSVVERLGSQFKEDPTIWLFEYFNEANLDIDFPTALYTRGEMIHLFSQFAQSFRTVDDRHLLTSGNSLPRPYAFHLHNHLGWNSDTEAEFLQSLNAENPLESDVLSIHLYPDPSETRSWDGENIINLLPIMVADSKILCKPVLIGEFGAKDWSTERTFVDAIAKSEVPLAAVWGYRRKATETLDISDDTPGRRLLEYIGRHNKH